MQFDTPTASEMPLIYDSWARSWRKSPWAGCIRNLDYDQVSRNTIGEILDRGARVICAVQGLEDGSRRVMGYSVSEPAISTLHWIYVKDTYRVPGLQVGTQLLKETVREFTSGVWTYTHRTPASFKFLGPGWTHDPVAARVKR
jgi:hypothetical protein